jgi:hypothetical protein
MTRSLDELYVPKAMSLDELFAAIRPPPLLPVGYGPSGNSGSTAPSFAPAANTAQPIPPDRLWAGVQPVPLSSFPEDQSFGSRLVDNALDIAGKTWTLPNTALGVAYGGLGTVAGLLAGTHPQVRLGHNGVQFLNNPFVNSKSAFTLGNANLYGQKTGPDHNRAYGDPNVKFGPHEEGHTYQAQVLGPLYGPAYLLGGGFTGLEGNVFERAAQRYGGGRGSWWP